LYKIKYFLIKSYQQSLIRRIKNCIFENKNCNILYSLNQINMLKFTHLHVHSSYSILDGMSPISDLVDKCIASGMSSVALTDHGNMFGVKDFFDYVSRTNKKTKEEIAEIEDKIKSLTDTVGQENEITELKALIEKKEQQKFKPIIGCEVYVARETKSNPKGSRFVKEMRENYSGHHLVLLAKNKVGYTNLCKLVSLGWIEGEYYHPRIDKEILKKYKEGLIVTSACLAGEIHRKIEANNYEEAKKSVEWFKEVFGDDYYLELQRHKTDKKNADTNVYQQQEHQNKILIQLARETQTKLVATNDVHFVEEEHAEAHEHLICLNTGRKIDDTDRLRYTKQEWLKTPEEMYEIFSDIPEALENTQEIADKVEFYSINHEVVMPEFDIPKEFGTVDSYRQKYSEEDIINAFSSNEPGRIRIEKLGGFDKAYRIKLEADYLRELTMKGAEMRYGTPLSEEVIERINYELDVIRNMGYPGYFLIVQDLIRAAINMNVSVGPGRGSAAGSVVSYCLQITNIDPIHYNLLFERFLNPDRISLPDIDIDFDDEGRKKVLEWVINKYGQERVAYIITYGTMAAKSSIRDVARVRNIPLEVANKLAKYIPDSFPADKQTGKAPKVTLKNCIELVPELKEIMNSNDKELINTLKYAMELEGTVRQTGVHACGIIVGADTLTNYIPLCTQKDKDSNQKLLVTQYEGASMEDVGLVKVDFLGLKTLSIIDETLRNIQQSKKINLNIEDISLEDKDTYQLFSEGNTIGIFQFESVNMRKFLRKLKPSKFGDLIAMNALYRPGPMDYIDLFIDRKQGKEKIEYIIPEMENRLKETYGVTVYQEQVMLLSRDIADFTRGESDELRKAMGKKKKDVMDKMKDKFMTRGQAKGHDIKILEKIWNDWEAFAQYAFNKSHSTCYAFIAFQTAYLKAHYPAEFMAANLTHNISNISEISKLIDECQRLGSKVLGPNINESGLHFNVDAKGEIPFGLAALKGVGEVAAAAIIDERNKNGEFTSVLDFFKRINLRSCNKRCIESLAKAGAFDSFGDIHRAQFFAESENTSFIEKLIRYGSNYQSKLNSTQISLFDDETLSSDDNDILEFPICEPWSDFEQLHYEKDVCGFYISGHPLDKYKLEIDSFCNYDITTLQQEGTLKKLGKQSQSFTIAGIITGTFVGDTYKGEKFGRITIEDYENKLTLSLFGENYLKLQHFFQQNIFVFLELKSELRKGRKGEFDEDFELRVINIHPLANILDTYTKTINLLINLEDIDNNMIDALYHCINKSKGNVPVHFKVFDLKNNLDVQLVGTHKVNPVDFSINVKNIPKVGVKLTR